MNDKQAKSQKMIKEQIIILESSVIGRIVASMIGIILLGVDIACIFGLRLGYKLIWTLGFPLGIVGIGLIILCLWIGVIALLFIILIIITYSINKGKLDVVGEIDE